MSPISMVHRRPTPPVDSAEAVRPRPPTWAQRRCDALVDLVEEAVAHLEERDGFTTERITVDVILDYDALVQQAGRGDLLGGPPLTGEAARGLACDAGIHRIVVKGRSEVLDVGRRTRQWNRAQRRALLFRHGGRCAIPGCDRRVVQLHHTTWWQRGGNTDLDDGLPLCHGHHHLVHEGGWDVSDDPVTGVTTLVDPDGRRLQSAAA